MTEELNELGLGLVKPEDVDLLQRITEVEEKKKTEALNALSDILVAGSPVYFKKELEKFKKSVSLTEKDVAISEKIQARILKRLLYYAQIGPSAFETERDNWASIGMIRVEETNTLPETKQAAIENILAGLSAETDQEKVARWQRAGVNITMKAVIEAREKNQKEKDRSKNH